MRSRLQPLSLVAVLGLVGALAGSGCGAQSASAETIVRAAPAKSQKAKTARMAINVLASGSHTPGQNISGEGVIDLVNRKADITMDAGTSAIPGKLRVIESGTILYMQLPPQLASQVPGGKPFIRLDLEALGKQQGVDIAALQQQNPDADSQMAFLQGAGADFHKVGTEKVRGADTTHYQGSVDLKKAEAAATRPEVKTSLQKAEQQLGSSTMPMDVWADSSGRLRRLSYKFDLGKMAAANGAAGQTGELTETLELFDYGVKVNVVEPPADQTTDFSALMAQAGASSSSSGAGKTP